MNSPNPHMNSIDAQKALNYSGILVTAMVGALASFSVLGNSVFPFVALLSTTQLALFVVCLRISPNPYYAHFFWAEAICIATLFFIAPVEFIYILTVVWLVQAVELYGFRVALQLLFASVVVYLLAQLHHRGTEQLLSIVLSTAMYVLLQLFAVSVVQRFVGEREQKEKMATLNRELISTRDLLSQTTAQGERLRIARDLHDILGHHMTALILNLEVASHGVEGEGKEKVEQSLALAKLLLGDLRSTVSELRDEVNLDLEESIKKLVSGIPEFEFEIDFTAAPKIDDVDIAETLLRCTQEAVTNVLKHSNATQCRIEMTGDERRLVLTVLDNGNASSAITPGNGLTGMKERVNAKGGDIIWQRNAKGFQLQISMGLELA